jgi:hypothetical protein
MRDAREPHQTDGRSIEGLCDHIRALPLADQVELVRRVTPLLLAELDDDDRNDLVTDLNRAIVREAMSVTRR